MLMFASKVSLANKIHIAVKSRKQRLLTLTSKTLLHNCDVNGFSACLNGSDEQRERTLFVSSFFIQIMAR